MLFYFDFVTVESDGVFYVIFICVCQYALFLFPPPPQSSPTTSVIFCLPLSLPQTTPLLLLLMREGGHNLTGHSEQETKAQFRNVLGPQVTTAPVPYVLPNEPA